MFAGNEHPSRQLVNPSVPSFPDRDTHLGNYIVARPDHNVTQSRHVHAEKILLDRLLRLEALKDEYDPTIVLYSWMMPCTGCTNALIQSLRNHRSNVIIVYTIDWKGVDLDTNQQNRQRLCRAGIQVYQVDYNLRLPSV